MSALYINVNQRCQRLIFNSFELCFAKAAYEVACVGGGHIRADGATILVDQIRLRFMFLAKCSDLDESTNSVTDCFSSTNTSVLLKSFGLTSRFPWSLPAGELNWKRCLYFDFFFHISCYFIIGLSRHFTLTIHPSVETNLIV